MDAGLVREAARRIGRAGSVAVLEDLGIEMAPHSTLNSYLEKLIWIVTGNFAKHGVTVAENALSDWNAVEARYDEKRGLKPGRRLGCQAQIQSDVVIDVPAESQVHRQVVRKKAEHRDIKLDTSVRLHFVEVQRADPESMTSDADLVESLEVPV